MWRCFMYGYIFLSSSYFISFFLGEKLSLWPSYLTLFFFKLSVRQSCPTFWLFIVRYLLLIFYRRDNLILNQTLVWCDRSLTIVLLCFIDRHNEKMLWKIYVMVHCNVFGCCFFLSHLQTICIKHREIWNTMFLKKIASHP